jgi:preprotein translocase subunit SecG
MGIPARSDWPNGPLLVGWSRVTPAAPTAKVRSFGAVLVFVFLVVTAGLHYVSMRAKRNGLGAFAQCGCEDGTLYFEFARRLWLGQGVPFRVNIFPEVLAQFMRVFGPDTLALKMIGVGFLVLGIQRLATLVDRPLDSAKPKGLIFLFAASYTSLLFWSSNSLFRDPYIYGSICWIIWAVSSLAVGPRMPRHWIALVGFGWFLSELRPYAIGILGSAIVMWWAVERFGLVERWTKRSNVILRITLLLAAAFLAMTLLRSIAVAVLQRDPFLYRENRAAGLVGGSSLNLRFTGSLPRDLLTFFWSAFLNSLGPMPWQWRSPQVLLAGALELPWLVTVLASTVKLVRRGAVSPPVRFCLCLAFCWLATLALWSDNLGNATRQRVPAWLALMVPAASWMETRQRRSIETQAVSGLIRSSEPLPS